MSADRWLAVHARERADQPALIFGQQVVSFAELEARSLRLAAKLHGLEIGQGDRVAILHANHPVYVELIHALILLGATAVPLNTRLTIGELRGLLDAAAPKLLIHGPEFDDVIRDVEHTLPTLRVHASRDLHGLPEKPAALPDSPRLEADQAILFTSGTSGQAKGVRLSLGNHLASAAGSAQRLGTLPGDRWLLCMPLFHVGGLAIVLRAAIQGMCVVLEPRFEPEAVLETLTSARINLVSLVPTMLERLLDHAGERALPEDLRGVLLGGGPVPESLLERARALRVPVAPSYGLTEACSQVATMTPAEVREGRNCAGQPLPGVEIRIVGANDLPVDPDQEGEIQVRGAQVMQGYLDQPEATQFTLRDGWLHTGDIGRIDVEGYLTVLDRRQDLIVSGGENVYPAEVEAILLRHPQIRDAAVIGQPDASWGQIVHAFVVVTAGQQLPRQELIQHCRAHLAGFKVPREVSFMGSLPRTPTGKLQRERLRQS